MTIATETRPEIRRSIFDQFLAYPVLLAAVLATCASLFVPRSMADPDIWWHLRNAQYHIHTHRFITRDTYSFTTVGAPWMDHEWLAELPFYLGWQWLGARGLFLVTAFAVECIFLGVFVLAYRRAGNPKAALFVTVIATFLATVSFGPRTLLFGWIALVVELFILNRFMEQSPHPFRKVLWMLPLLFGVWVNTHGSWLIGLVILLTFVICGCVRIRAGFVQGAGWTNEQRKTLAIATGLSVCALFINPYGWRLVAYPFNLAFHQKLNIANVDEWASLDFHSARGHVLLVSLTAIFFAQIFKARKWAPYELAFLFLGVYSAFTYSRFLFLAAILFSPLFVKHMTWLPPYRPEENKPWLNAAVLCVLAGMVVHHFPSRFEKDTFGGKAFPESALPYLRSFHPQGNVFNDYLWGGYLDWHLRQVPVFIDSRMDIFEYAGVLKDYLDATRMKDSIFILDKYRIRYVLFQPDAPLVYLLQQTHQWKTDYQDQSTILLERMAPLAPPSASSKSSPGQ